MVKRRLKDWVIVIQYGYYASCAIVSIPGLSHVATLHNHSVLSIFLISNPREHFLLANFPQKFDQKLISNPGGQFLLDFL